MDIIKIINDSKLSDMEISKRIGCARSTIWRIRKGERSPTLKLANKIYEALKK